MSASSKADPHTVLGWLRWKIWLWWLVANIAGYPTAGALYGIWQWRGLRTGLARVAWWALSGVVDLVAAVRRESN